MHGQSQSGMFLAGGRDERLSTVQFGVAPPKNHPTMGMDDSDYYLSRLTRLASYNSYLLPTTYCKPNTVQNLTHPSYAVWRTTDETK